MPDLLEHRSVFQYNNRHVIIAVNTETAQFLCSTISCYTKVANIGMYLM